MISVSRRFQNSNKCRRLSDWSLVTTSLLEDVNRRESSEVMKFEADDCICALENRFSNSRKIFLTS